MPQAATKEATASCAEAVTRSETLEGELAGCRGRLEGLGEGCGRCWHMLEAARVSSQLLHCGSTYTTDSHHGHPVHQLKSMLILGACLPAGGGAPGEVGDWACCSWSMQLRSCCGIRVWLGPVAEGAALTCSPDPCCLCSSALVPASPCKSDSMQGMVQRHCQPLVSRVGLRVQVLFLRLENEKLRCAATEAQGGLHHRTRLRQQFLGQDTLPHAARPHR